MNNDEPEGRGCAVYLLIAAIIVIIMITTIAVL